MNTEKGRRIYRLGKLHSCTFVRHSFFCSDFSKFVPAIEWLFVICLAPKTWEPSAVYRTKLYSKWDLYMVVLFQGFQGPSRCTRFCSHCDSLQLVRKNFLFLGFLTMSLSEGPWKRSEWASWLVFFISGKMKHTVFLWFTLTPRSKLDTKKTLYWVTYKVESLVTRLKVKDHKRDKYITKFQFLI